MTQLYPCQKTCMVSAWLLPWCWCSSVTKLCPILCHSMTCNMLELLVLHYLLSLLKFLPVEMVMLSKLLILCHPLLLWPSIFPSIRVFSNESTLHIRWPKYWSFSVSISHSNDWLVWSPCCPRDSQESSLASQFKVINSSVLNLPYGPTLMSIHNYWKVSNNLWRDSTSLVIRKM